jgi:hypothetical protein
MAGNPKYDLIDVLPKTGGNKACEMTTERMWFKPG